MSRLRKCCYCGGSVHPEVLPYYDQPWLDNTYRFEDVPALVCAACGEVFFEAAVSQAMDKVLTSNPQPKRFAQVPIVELLLGAKVSA